MPSETEDIGQAHRTSPAARCTDNYIYTPWPAACTGINMYTDKKTEVS
jgi:hypothetical protein